jgi:hypothetical protein
LTRNTFFLGLTIHFWRFIKPVDVEYMA